MNLLYEDRQYLLQRWGFNCTCALCSSPTARAASDGRLLRIQAILDELKVKENRSHTMVGKLTVEVLNLLEAEGLWAQVGDFYTVLTQVHLEMNNVRVAKKYAEMTLESRIMYSGAESESMEKAERMVRQLTRAEKKKKGGVYYRK